MDVRRVPEIINKAFRVATSGQPGPVYIDLPGDVLYREVEENAVPFPEDAPWCRVFPVTLILSRKPLRLLKDAKRPVVLTGTGILWSGRWQN